MRKLIFVVLLLSGCVSTSMGSRIDQAQMASFKKGITTEADVINALGKPVSIATGSDGVRVISYYFSDTHVSGLIGLGGKMRSQSETTSFIFEPDSKLRSYQSSESNHNMN